MEDGWLGVGVMGAEGAFLGFGNDTSVTISLIFVLSYLVVFLLVFNISRFS